MVIFNSFGLDTYGIRESALGVSLKKIFSNIVLIRFVLYLLTFVVSLVIINIVEIERTTYYLFLYLLGSLFFWDMSHIWFLQTLGQYKLIAFSKIIYSIVYFLSVLFFIKDIDDLLCLGLIYFLSTFLFFLYYLRTIFIFFDLSQIDIVFLKSIVGGAFIFFLIHASTELYTSFDKIIIGLVIDKHAVGVYEAAFKIYSLLLIFFQVLWLVFAPRLANGERVVFNVFMLMLSLFGVILFILMISFGNELIYLLFGDMYSGANEIIFVYAFIVIATIIRLGLGSSFAILGYEKFWLKTVLLAVMFNILLTFLLIFKFGLIGAALATLFTEVFVALVLIFNIKKLLYRMS